MKETIYCPCCESDVVNDASNRTSLADHGRCVDCQIKWKHGELPEQQEESHEHTSK